MVETMAKRKKSNASPVPSAAMGDIQDKFADARAMMRECLIEREDEIDVVLTALLCSENPLLVGPPGTAKSMLLDSVMEWLGNGHSKFSILFNKTTVPEEVFGPISVKGLKEDVYRRITTGKLAACTVAFGDEIFKASTAILNTLLRIINERVYENGDGVFRPVPLLMFVAASNEWPNTQEELGALFDRFLFRKTVRYIGSRQGRDKLLWVRNHKPQFDESIDLEEIKTAQCHVKVMKVTDGAKEAFGAILDELAREGIRPGDRRIYKSVDAVKAYAFLNGKQEVGVEDLEILAHTLWVDPLEQPEKCFKVVGKIANPAGTIITDKMMQIQEIMDKHNPTEAVPKLQAIQRELKQLSATGNNEARLKSALKHVAMSIDSSYRQVVGDVGGDE